MEMPEQHQPQMVCLLRFTFSLSTPVSSPVTPGKQKLIWKDKQSTLQISSLKSSVFYKSNSNKREKFNSFLVPYMQSMTKMLYLFSFVSTTIVI